MDISSPNVANYEFTQNVAAVGKFDKTIMIYDIKNDKSLFSLKVPKKIKDKANFKIGTFGRNYSFEIPY